MKTIGIGCAVLLIVALSAGPAAAWSASGRFGGHASGGGSWSASGARGGSASGGGGSWSGTGAYGGHASGGGGSWSATGAYGGHAYGSAGYGATVYPHYGYHPPTTVNYYGHGCYGCGGWAVAGAVAAGASVGIAAGAAVAAANTAAATTSAYSSGYAAGSTTATSEYSAGYAAGAATGTTYVMNAIYPTLPAGCASPNVGGTTYFSCGDTWFQPSYGANGVYYRVVPTP